MTVRKLFLGLLMAFLGVSLAACLPVEDALPRQHVVEWPGQRLLFVADERGSRVQSFHLSSGAPVACAQTRQSRHSRVRDMQLDVPHGKLWVLGYNGVSVYDARSLALQRYIPLEGASISAMRIERDRVVLLAGSGIPVGEIDSRSSVFG